MKRHFGEQDRWPRRLAQHGARATAVALACAQGAASAAVITSMGALPIADFSVGAVSDGGLVYGLAGAALPQSVSLVNVNSYVRAFSWSAASPQWLQTISTVDGGNYGGMTTISASGFAAGWSGGGLQGLQASIWGPGGPIVLNAPPGGSVATAISADGARAAGIRDFGGGPFVTGSTATFPGSNFPGGGSQSFLPSGLSDNGKAVVGTTLLSGAGSFAGYVAGQVNGIPQWLSITDVFPGIPGVSAGPGSSAVAISNPVIIPNSDPANPSFAVTALGNGRYQGNEQAFMFQRTAGGQSTFNYLGALTGDLSNRATAMVADGSLVIGTSTAPSGDTRPFLWTPGGGMQDLSTWLGGQGAQLGSWQLKSATAVSANGNYFAGMGLHNGQQEAWFVDLAATGPRTLQASGSVIDFTAAGDWFDASGNPATTAPGLQDEVRLRPGQLYQPVSIRVGPASAVRAALLSGTGSFIIEAGALNVDNVLTLQDANLAVTRQAVVSTKTLFIGGSGQSTGGLTIGQNGGTNGTRLVAGTVVVAERGFISQYETTTFKVTGTLAVHGEYFAFDRQGPTQLAAMEAGRIEVMTTCIKPDPCRPGVFWSGGAVKAGSIYNAGEFTWQGESLIVGSGTPANDPLDAFLNEGTLSVYRNANLASSPNAVTWTGNVTNAKSGTVKTYGFVHGTDASKIDWGTGTFTNLGAYKSDPVVNVFGTLIVGDEGYLTGGEGDAFQVRGDFTSTSTSTQWDVAKATLSFLGTGAHTYSASGSTAWGTLVLDAGATLALKASGSGPVHLSFASLAGFSSLADLQARFSADSGITIDVASIGGGWAGAGTITLPGGGTLISAVPEPAAAWTLLAGLLGLGLLRRRSRA